MEVLKNNKLTIAVDFDDTLCTEKFPEIGTQTKEQEELMMLLIKLQSKGFKLILWTCRGDNEERLYLTEAIEWCKIRGLTFDAINENIKEFEKPSGYSPKVCADIYVDDKSIKIMSNDWMIVVNNILKNILRKNK